MQLLRQSAAWTFQLGPFVDSTDGVTPEASLTIAATDVDVSKNGAAYANKNDATAMTGTGDSQGWYDCVLDATDTGTLGKLDVRCYVSGALPVWREFMVIPANAYDALVAGTGVGVRADVQGWAGTVATAGAIPAVVAGAAGGVFIAGTNAATTITTALTANITGNITGDLSGTVGTLTTYTGNTPQTGDTYALANGATGFVAIDTVVDAVKVVTDALPEGGAFTTIAADTARLTAARAAVLTDWIDGGRLDLLLDTIPTTAMRGTDSAALASVCTEGRLAELDAGNLPADIAALSVAANPATMQTTTIATLASQTSFTLSAGSADDDAYINCMAIVTDSATAAQKAIGRVSAYAGATLTVTLQSDPGIFTMAAGDAISIMAELPSSLLGPGADERWSCLKTTASHPSLMWMSG
jgi:hypothetical protein